MKLIQAAVLQLLVVLAAGTKLGSAQGSNVDYDHLQRSIVRIQSVMPKFDWFRPFLTSEGGTSLGSGFIVQTEPYLLIATNQHVINDAISVKIQLLLHSETKWPVNVVAACPKFDLALLTLKDDAGFKATLKKAGIDPKALPLSKDVAQMGMDVVALGFPLGQTSLKISKGNVAGNEVVNKNLCIQSTAPISPGNSGGPLLNADGTTIVGVNFAGATSGENINYVIPAWRVSALVSKHLKDQPNAPKDGAWQRLGFKTADHGLLTQQPNAALYKASHGCKKGVFVGKVHGDGFMAEARPKVKAGSMLVSVNDREIDVFGTTPIKDLMMGRAHLDDLFFIKGNLEDEVPFTTCYRGKEIKHHVNTSWSKKNDQGINYIDEPVIDKRDKNYEMFGDIGVMDMTVNHVADALRRSGSAQITRWLLPDRVTEPRLMVIYVRPGSYVTDVLPEGAAVEKLNGKTVRTLDEWREALAPEEGQVWTLETDLGVVVALPFEKTLSDQLKRSVGQPYLLTKGAQAIAEKLGFIKEVDGPEDGDEEEEGSNETSNETKEDNDDSKKSSDGKKDQCYKELGQGICGSGSGFYKKIGMKIGRNTVTEVWADGVAKTLNSCMAYCRGEHLCKAISFGPGSDCTLFSRECAKPLKKSGDDEDVASYKKMDENICAKAKKAKKAEKAAKAEDEQNDEKEEDSKVKVKSDDKKDGDDDDSEWTDDYVRDDSAPSQTFLIRWFGWMTEKKPKPHSQAAVLLQGSSKNARSHAKAKASAVAMQAAGPLQVEVGPRGGLVARSIRVAHADEIAAVVTGNM